MARAAFLSLLFSVGALLLALVAIRLDSLREYGIHVDSLRAYGIDLDSSLREYGVDINPILDYGIDLLVPSQFLPAPVVLDTTRDIRYVGSRSAAGVEHFQNIFYGEDTSGKNRFAPPVPVQHARGSVIDASQTGAWCPQGTGDILPFTTVVTNVSENCLSLRIARARGTRPDARLPVMVWLHGGGHALGSGSDVLYTPDGLVNLAATDGQPLIYVAINYRLGFFGFATTKALIDAKHTNAGLRDQRAALEWVRDNIVNFGGDPQRVTVVGQSVGASDVSLQLTAFGGERGAPFQQAVMMSGALGLNFNIKNGFGANNTAAVVEKAGCAKNGDTQSEETVQCLREASVEILTNLSISAAREAHPPFGEAYFYPTYDGDFIPDRPSELMRAGKFVKGVPIIIAWVANDGAWYALPTTLTDEEVLDSFGRYVPSLSEASNRGLLDLYPVEDFEHMVRPAYDGPISPQYYRAAHINRDIWFSCPSIDFAWQYAKHGGTDRSRLRLYEHNATRYTPTYEAMGVPMWRVGHLSDIPYVLNIQNLGGGVDNSPAQLALSEKMSRSIAGFIHSGIPGGGAEEWQAAFVNMTALDLEKEFPDEFGLKLWGGPHDGASLTISKHAGEERTSSYSEAELAVEWEKLFDRCEFINSEKFREEASV